MEVAKSLDALNGLRIRKKIKIMRSEAFKRKMERMEAARDKLREMQKRDACYVAYLEGAGVAARFQRENGAPPSATFLEEAWKASHPEW